jgi:thiamine-phosphate pyrophosphorylase
VTLPFSLLLITDWSLGSDALLARLDDALHAGPGIAVQHRHPGATDRALFDEGLLLRSLCHRHGAPLFVNGRIDLALALDAHLHCTSSSLEPRIARPLLPGRLISTVVHDVHDSVEGADAALVSPVFPPGSKPDDRRTPLGPEGFLKIARALACPAIALGGITPGNRGQVDAPAVAVISAVLHAVDPRAAAQALLREPARSD